MEISRPVQAIIFDLDNCLVPGDAIGRAAYEPAFEAIRRANDGTLNDTELAAAFADMWRHPLEDVARLHRFTAAMLAAGWRVFADMEARAPMQGYPDLGVIAELPVPRFLVTTGFRRLQESKIAALGLRAHFTEVRIDVVDEPGRKGKQQLFREIQQAYQDQLGKQVAPSTVYRLLDRHGWRKVVPRPRHPKANVAAQAAFKKTAPHGTPRGRAPG